MEDAPLSPEEVAHRGFGTAFRGFDTGEVRGYLQRVANELRASVARERDLHRRLADAEHRAAHPVLEGDTLTRALGDEMGRILATAQEAAQDLRSRAEDNAARILREAHEQAQRIRTAAEGVLAERTQEAEAHAAEIRQAAAVEAAAVVEGARREAAAAMEDVENRARQLVQEAQAARLRIVGDLTRRRRIVQAQVDQLRAGRDRLLDAYRVVRRTLDEVADELERVEGEARHAAEVAGERAVTDLDREETDDVLAAFPAPSPAARAPAGQTPPPAAVEVEVTEPAALAEEGSAAAAPPPTAGEPPPPEAEEPIGGEPAGEARPSPARGVPPVSGALRRLDLVEAPSAAEGVRVVSSPADTADQGAPPPPPPPPEVDELFARIRAGRAEAVARAEQVLADDEAAPGPGAEPGGTGADAPGSAEVLLQRRDAAIEGIETKLARRLKRALQDEQNEVLDRLRSLRGAPPTTALPPVAEQAARYREAAVDLLGAAAEGGARFAGADTAPAVDEVAVELAESLAGGLHRALQASVAGERGAEEPTVVMERIGAAYRGYKAQRIEGLAGDAVTAAFARGVVAGSPPGSPLQWIVDDDGLPCPDCDDNALAGPTAPGEVFPTGQAHPPAHAGCRCLLAPARLAAAMAGAG